MAARIVLFGATGYTGRLAAEAMVERGARAGARGPHPVEAGRRWPRSWAAASRPRTADVSRPAERARRWSSTATCWSRPSGRSRAGVSRPRRPRSTERRALHRLDRRAAVHPRGVRALRAGGRAGGHRDAHRDRATTGCPGNLAGAPRARRAPGELATRVDVGYFITGSGARPSGGTQASLVGAIVGACLRASATAARPDRARREARAQLPGRLEGSCRAISVGELRALRAAARWRRACARSNALPRLVRAGVARDAGRSPAGTSVA